MQADGGREVTAQHGQEVKSIPKWGLHASRTVGTQILGNQEQEDPWGPD